MTDREVCDECMELAPCAKFPTEEPYTRSVICLACITKAQRLLEGRTGANAHEPPPKKNDHRPCWDGVLEFLEKEQERDRLLASLPKEARPTMALALDGLVNDIKTRDAYGKAKYGTSLQPFNGRNAAFDLYQEILDAIVYTQQLIDEMILIEDDTFRGVAREGMDNNLRLLLHMAAGLRMAISQSDVTAENIHESPLAQQLMAAKQQEKEGQ